LLFRNILNETEHPKIILAIDNSGSMVSGADSAYVRNTLLSEIEALRKNVSAKYDIYTMFFGSDVSSVQDAEKNFSEKETDIDALLHTVSDNNENHSLGALGSVSDGIYN